jgi:hypothetical protein
MNTCESTNELIKKAAFDVMLLIGLWGTANIAITDVFINKNTNKDKAEKMILVIELGCIFSTALRAYKYYQ